jgi:hypothetical protein
MCTQHGLIPLHWISNSAQDLDVEFDSGRARGIAQIENSLEHELLTRQRLALKLRGY